MTPSSSPTLRQRLSGCLFGGAVGDALGAPVEPLSRQRIADLFGPDGITDFQDDPAPFTDDTQMTVWTADGLIRDRLAQAAGQPAEPVEQVFRAYRRWLLALGVTPPLDPAELDAVRNGWLFSETVLHDWSGPGLTCLTSIRNAPAENRPAIAPNHSKGCGTVMRVAPVAFLHDHDPFSLGAATGALTHGHPTSHLAAGTYAQLLTGLIDGADLVDATLRARERLAQEPGSDETLAAIDAALDLAQRGTPPSADRVEELGKGWVAEEALAIALYCALVYAGDARAALILAVNHSGDSDSTGALCGQMIGTWRGGGVLPGDLVTRVQGRDLLAQLTDDMMTVLESKLAPDHPAWDDLIARYPV